MKTIFILIGSGGHGIDTLGKETPIIKSLGRRIKEHEFNAPVFEIMAAELRRHGVIVVDDAPTDFDTPLATRVAIANNTYKEYVDKYGKANVKCVYVSIHYNAFDSKFDGEEKDPSGFSVHIQTGRRSSDSGKLAACILNELKGGTVQKNRGIVEQNLAVTRDTVMPAALSECGFMDNEREANLMLNPAFQRETGIEHAKGVLNYFGLAYKEPVSKPDAPKPVVPVRGFEDLNGHWALQSILPFIDAGLMNGVSDKEFGPDKPMTRAQWCVMMTRMGFAPKEVK